MSTLRLIVGADQTLQADAAALPAILGLCRSLGIPSHHNTADATLYIAVPATGKRLAVEAYREGPDQYRTVAAQTATALSERLAAAGARLARAPEDAPELLLRISPGALPSWGVVAGYGWQDWRDHRSLCAGLTEALSAAFGMPDLGARMSLAGGRQGGVPVVEVAVGRPAPGAPDPLLDPAFPAKAADALYRGLCRFWTDPALAEVCAALPSALSAPPAETAPPPEEPVLQEVAETQKAPEETDPVEETVEICRCETDTESLEPEIERIILDPVTVTSYQPAPATPPHPTAEAPAAPEAATTPAAPEVATTPELLETPEVPDAPTAVVTPAPVSPLVYTFFAPAPPPRPKPKSLITRQSAALSHIQAQAQKIHPR